MLESQRQAEADWSFIKWNTTYGHTSVSPSVLGLVLPSWSAFSWKVDMCFTTLDGQHGLVYTVRTIGFYDYGCSEVFLIIVSNRISSDLTGREAAMTDAYLKKR